MSRNSYQASKGRGEGTEQFLMLPGVIARSPGYARLSSHAVKLLVDIGCQYKGGNNGDLCATWSMMKLRGWKSQDTLYKALKELLEMELIIKSRQGGRHLPTLYAITWRPINSCGGKLDIASTGKRIPGNWRKRMYEND